MPILVAHRFTGSRTPRRGRHRPRAAAADTVMSVAGTASASAPEIGRRAKQPAWSQLYGPAPGVRRLLAGCQPGPPLGVLAAGGPPPGPPARGIPLPTPPEPLLGGSTAPSERWVDPGPGAARPRVAALRVPAPLLPQGRADGRGRPPERRARRGRRGSSRTMGTPWTASRRAWRPFLEVVDAVGGRAEILLDGGVRWGTDVVKALALGRAQSPQAGWSVLGIGGGRRRRRDPAARACGPRSPLPEAARLCLARGRHRAHVGRLPGQRPVLPADYHCDSRGPHARTSRPLRRRGRGNPPEPRSPASAVFTAAEAVGMLMMAAKRPTTSAAGRIRIADATCTQLRVEAEQEATRILEQARAEAAAITEETREASSRVEAEADARVRLREEVRLLGERIDWAHDGLREVAARLDGLPRGEAHRRGCERRRRGRPQRLAAPAAEGSPPTARRSPLTTPARAASDLLQQLDVVRIIERRRVAAQRVQRPAALEAQRFAIA